MLKLKYIWAVLMVVVLSSCEQGKYDREIEPPVELVSGEADFSSYVALGNSLTAGYADGALFIASQENAYPNLLAGRMSIVGAGEFSQPLMNDNTGGLLLAGNPTSQGPRLFFDGEDLGQLPGTPTTDITDIKPGPYNNMAVPGARSFHLLANGYGNIANLPLANSYFVRMASSPDASVLEDAMAQNPTFFSLWIGANDVLGYATSGGDGSEGITDKAIFDGAMAALVGTLTSGGAKGVIGNLPNIMTGAFFNFVSYAPLDPNDEESPYPPQIPLLNQAYGQLNLAFQALGYPERQVVFSETEFSPIVIFDESIDNIQPQLFAALSPTLGPELAFVLSNQYAQSRQSNEDDLITLTGGLEIGSLNTEYFQQLVASGVPAEQAGQLSLNGLTYPMPDTYVLIPTEQVEITAATLAFNSTIEQLATNAGLAYFDAYSLITDIAENGYSSDGVIVSGDLLTGGLFSLDGLHLTARGNAIVANEMMKLIDENFGSNFEEAEQLYDIGNFPVIYSPVLQ